MTFETLVPLGASSLVVAVVFYPVDVLRALKMSGTSRAEFYAKYGVRGFLGQGMLPEVTRATVMRASKFFFNPVMSKALWGKKPSECSIPQKIAAGALATFPEILAISPFEVAKLGLQVDTANKFNNSMLAFMKHTFKNRGISGLYCGWFGMQMRQSMFTGIYFGTLSTYRDYFQRANLPPFLGNLLGGFCAGVTGAICGNIPSDVVRSVVQKRMFLNPDRRAYGVSINGVVEHVVVAKELLRTEGIRGLYRGTLFKASYLGAGMAGATVLIPFFSDLFGIKYDI